MISTAPEGGGGRQLPLGLRWREWPRFDNFLPGTNGEALAVTRALARGEGRERTIYLWGEPGSGRSHLLQAACHCAAAAGAGPVYLPLAGDDGLVPAMLSGLDVYTPVCVDDVDTVAGQRDWEEALFHLYNRCEQRGARVLLCGRRAPAGAGFMLPDLASRLGNCLVLQLRALDDAGRGDALRERARARGLVLSDEVIAWLLSRVPRDMTALMGILERLDRHALATKRRVTVPLLRELLEAPPSAGHGAR